MSCGVIFDGWNKIDDRHDCPKCKECFASTELIMSATRSNPDYEAFQSLGFAHGEMEPDAKTAKNPTHFRSRRHFNEELKARNLAVAPKKQNNRKQRDFVEQKKKFKNTIATWE